MNKMKIKTKNLDSPWITKGIKKLNNIDKVNNVCIQSFKKKRISRLQKAF